MGKTFPCSVFSCRLDEFRRGSRFKTGDVQIVLAFSPGVKHFLLYGIMNLDLQGKRKTIYFTIPQDRIWSVLKKRNKVMEINEQRMHQIKTFGGNWDRVKEIVAEMEKNGEIGTSRRKPR